VPHQRARELCIRWEGLNPHPRCELFYLTPFQLLVSVVLSAQATDKSVNSAMVPLYKAGFGLEDVLAMGAEGFLPLIRSIGLAPKKSKYIEALAKRLYTDHGGQVPCTREALEALPGVGRKTAHVVLGELFKAPVLAVDTHVFRVGFRLGLHRATQVRQAEEELLRCFDEVYLPRVHHWMVLHGRYICKARAPLCKTCPVEDLCPQSHTFTKCNRHHTTER
jgi:endonuclease-3